MAAGFLTPSRDWFARSAVEVAPDLLGARLTHDADAGRTVLRITEVEAYLGVGDDPGSHAFRGRTRRNAVMFGDPGRLYVYFTYGMHTCANIVCSPPGTASAVLIRAAEVVEGIELAHARRGPARLRDLARGPARLTVAADIRLEHDGSDLLEPPFALEPLASPPRHSSGPRVGVSGEGGGATYPWRFWIPGDATVSVYRAATTRGGRGHRTAQPTPGSRTSR